MKYVCCLCERLYDPDDKTAAIRIRFDNGVEQNVDKVFDAPSRKKIKLCKDCVRAFVAGYAKVYNSPIQPVSVRYRYEEDNNV